MSADDQFEFPRVEYVIRWLAGASFTIYLINEPLLVLAAALSPDMLGARLISVVLVLCLVLVLAELGERRKYQYKKAFHYFFQLCGFSSRQAPM
jgi:hypothetical protein